MKIEDEPDYSMYDNPGQHFLDQLMISVDDEGWFLCQFSDKSDANKPIYQTRGHDTPHDALDQWADDVNFYMKSHSN